MEENWVKSYQNVYWINLIYHILHLKHTLLKNYLNFICPLDRQLLFQINYITIILGEMITLNLKYYCNKKSKHNKLDQKT